MAPFAAFIRRIKTARTLGWRLSAWYALYRFGLITGHYRRSTPSRRESAALALHPLWTPPPREELAGLIGTSGQAELAAEAAEILQGQARLFGGPPAPIALEPPMPLQHWTAYAAGRARWGAEDVKFIWEPARFGWAFTLGRAYRLTGDERCPAAFWQHFEAFDRANPPNLGPNWTSAQEVALRLVAWIFAAAIFASSPESTPARRMRLAQAVAEHAARIPITLPYARAQHNNHLVSEGLGLYAAGLALPAHPQAAAWQETGWRELNRALHSQIAPDGAYAQHSTNYHRLMLQAALIADAFRRSQGRAWPAETLAKLQAAVGWLDAQADPISGRAANLGHNDGAHILPLAGGGFAAYRPTLRAAARAFGLPPAGAAGPWDELSAWLGLASEPVGSAAPPHTQAGRLSNADGRGWASLRAQRFTSRPAHADQLHVEIWHQGENLALDAGAYRYNAPAPWTNALASTLVHNTVSVDGRDQMTRGGKFLWLDWAQAEWLETSPHALAAAHDGYNRLGLRHIRELWQEASGWAITDDFLPLPNAARSRRTFTVQWLLPDWRWSLGENGVLRLNGPQQSLSVGVKAAAKATGNGLTAPSVQLIRAGESLHGPPPPAPIFGWYSPAYAVLLPAVSLRVTFEARPPLRLSTSFRIAAKSPKIE